MKAGYWRGRNDTVVGLRECKNAAGSWTDACVGSSIFGEVFTELACLLYTT